MRSLSFIFVLFCSLSLLADNRPQVLIIGDIIYNGDLKNLKRFKDDVKEVKSGLECGIHLDNFSDFDVGDIIDVYEYKEIKAQL